MTEVDGEIILNVTFSIIGIMVGILIFHRKFKMIYLKKLYQDFKPLLIVFFVTAALFSLAIYLEKIYFPYELEKFEA